MKGARGGGAAGPALQSPGCEATVTGSASLSADIKVSSSFPPSLSDLRPRGSGAAVGQRGSSSAPSCRLPRSLGPLLQDFPAPPPSSSCLTHSLGAPEFSLFPSPLLAPCFGIPSPREAGGASCAAGWSRGYGPFGVCGCSVLLQPFPFLPDLEAPPSFLQAWTCFFGAGGLSRRFISCCTQGSLGSAQSSG